MAAAIANKRRLVADLTEAGEMGISSLGTQKQDLDRMIRVYESYTGEPYAADKASGPQPAGDSPTGIQQPTLPSGETFTPRQSTCDVEPL